MPTPKKIPNKISTPVKEGVSINLSTKKLNEIVKSFPQKKPGAKGPAAHCGVIICGG